MVARSDRPFSLLAALSGVLGTAALASSYVIVPTPSPYAGEPLLTTFANQHHNVLLTAAWLEGVGTALYVTFILAVLHFAEDAQSLAGKVTMLACCTVLGVSMLYDTTIIAFVESAAAGRATATSTSFSLFLAVEHVFTIAPCLFLPLSAVLIRAKNLARFGYLAAAFGCAAQMLGALSLFVAAAARAIDGLLIIENLWIVGLASFLVVSTRREQLSLLRHSPR